MIPRQVLFTLSCYGAIRSVNLSSIQMIPASQAETNNQPADRAVKPLIRTLAGNMIIQKAISGITTSAGIAVAFVTGIVVAGSWKNHSQRDLLITLPPIIIPAILSAFAVLTLVSQSDNRKWIGVRMGMCVGSLLYLVFPGLQLAFQYDIIVNDGTGFWALIMLPSVYFGIPLPIIGALLGLTIGFIVDRVNKKRKGEPSHGSDGSPAVGSPPGQA